MLSSVAQVVYDHHQPLLPFALRQRMCAFRKSHRRAHKFASSPQSIEHSFSIGSPHTSGSISVSPKVSNDTTAFYEFSSSSSMFSTSVQSHIDTLARRGERRYLSRENKITEFWNDYPHGEHLFFILVSSTLHFCRQNPHGFCATAVYFLHGFFFTLLRVAFSTAVESAGCSRIPMHTIPFLFRRVHIVGTAHFLIMKTANVDGHGMDDFN